jgi:hypothetical protein
MYNMNINPEDNLTPEEKKMFDLLKEKIRQLTGKEVPSPHEIWEHQKKGTRIMLEWHCQDKEQIEALPQEIKDLKLTGRYSLCCAISGQAPIIQATTAIDMAIEAAFNFGKAEKNRKYDDTNETKHPES